MKKIIIFCFALFLFFNLPSASADGGRRLQGSTGYGGGSGGGSSYTYTPPPEEEYENINYGGGGGSSGYGGGSGGGGNYGGGGSYTPPPEEHYEEQYYHEEKYEEQYHHEEYYSYTPTYETYETETHETYEAPTYGYGGTPYYNNANNQTYTSNYEEAYTSGGSSSGGGGGTKPNVPFVPTSLMTGFVVDIHFLSGDTTTQYIAYHYCSDLYPGYTQCDIYNGSEINSRLIATEVVVSGEIFNQLPMEERQYWHSHAFAVKSGILVSPNTPPEQDLQVMSSVMNSYGKITDFWHSGQNFPFGGAKLAYGLADQSQFNEAIANQLDQELGLKTTWQQRAQARASLNPTILPGADSYLTTGEFPQYFTQKIPAGGASGETGESGESGAVGGGATEEGSAGGGAPEEGFVGGGAPEEGFAGGEAFEESPVGGGAEEELGAVGGAQENGESPGAGGSQESGTAGAENGESSEAASNGENGSITILPEDFGEGESQ